MHFMRKFHPNSIFFLFLFFLTLTLSGVNPQINSVIPVSTTIPKYEKLELVVLISATYNSPYDFDQVNLQCTFTSPTGKIYEVDGFYYQPFTMPEPDYLISAGQPDWRIRFSPNETGLWSYVVKITDTQGSASYPTQQFTCVVSSHKGFIKHLGDHLVHDNGERFLGLGTNLAWTEWGSGFTVYDDWLVTLNNNGGNFIKITMAPWIFGLEWGSGTLGNYNNRQNRAWGLDWIFDKMTEYGIYCQFHFLVHDELRPDNNTGWNENPYKSANGGPCNNPQDFFTNATAKKFYKQKIRYSIARWGYSSYLHSWEIMSEADNTGFFESYQPDIYNWLIETAEFVKNRDVYQRPVTSGFAWPQNDPLYWNNPMTDFTQTHNYDFVPDLEMKVYNYSNYYRDFYQKPTITGEFALGHDPAAILQADPDGIAFHNVLWSSVFSGNIGSAMSWWWDNYLYTNNLFTYFQPVSTFINQAAIKETSWYHTLPLTSSDIHETLYVFPDFSSTSEKAPSNTFDVGPSGAMNPTVMDLGKHLYGSLYNSLRNPPTFNVNYLKPGKFNVRTSGIAVFSKIRIRLNGNTIINVTASTNTTYSIDVPAGLHTIKVDNSGSGLLKIEKYEFENYMPQLRAFVLRKSNHIAGWFQNINYNWKQLLETGTPPPVSGGKINLENLPYGLYKVDWYNGEANLDSTQYKFTTNGKFVLDAPAVIWDGAFDIVYHAPFNIDFSAIPQSGLSPLTVQFTDETSYVGGSNYNYVWTFGDGTVSFQQNPEKTYNSPGAYAVTLYVNNGQYSHFLTKPGFIVVEQPVIADFNALPTIVLPEEQIQFNDQSLGNPLAWNWNFGDGTVSSDQNPVKNYLQPGFYSVMLTVQKETQIDTITKIDYIEVLVPLVADFSANTTLVIPGQEVVFNDLTAGNPASWQWDFGNGTTSNQQNPSVIYTDPGNYSVSLYVSTAYQQDTLVKSGYITVLIPLEAEFEADTTIVVSGETVEFTDFSQGSPSSWFWTFGDGESSDLQHPDHTFFQSGYRTISLTISDTLQTSTEMKQDYIQVLELLIADFSADTIMAVAGQSISFTDLTSGGPTSWLWNFENEIFSNLQHPTITFISPGNYNASLTVANEYQQHTVTKENFIQILEVLVADFTADTTFGWIGQPISFYDLSSGNPDTWLWDFGNGRTSGNPNPVYVFNQEGCYTISLTVQDALQTSTKIKTSYILIQKPLIADFTADTTLLIKGNNVQFTDLTIGDPTGWFWVFGDGSQSTEQHPVHLFDTIGEFTVKLRAGRDTLSSIKIKQNFIKVIPLLEAEFEADKQLAYINEPIQFTDYTTGNPESWFWDFGNYSNAVVQNPMISYSEPGLYTIRLNVSNQFLQDSLEKTDYLTIIEPLNAAFSSNFQQVGLGDVVSFYDLTTGNPETWQWWLSSGDTLMAQNPSVSFWETGFVSVTLIVSNPYLFDTLTVEDYIHVLPPSYSQIIPLNAGWTGISAYVQPYFPAIETIFAPVMDKCVYAFNEQGIFWPALNINTIGLWDVSKGLVINMNAADSLFIEGYNLAEGEKQLAAGWNLFPVLSPCAQSSQMLNELLGNEFRVLKTADGTCVFWPEMGINTCDTLQPGRSYFIMVSQDTLFFFPACTGE